MASCSGIKTCLSEGSTECTLGSETCPPCVYALTGGDYSCYSRDTSAECPFSGTYAECDKTSTSTSSSNGDTTPTATTKTPAKTTATPTEAPTDAPAETPAPETRTTGTTGTTGTSGQTDDTSTTTQATTAPSTSTSSSNTDPTQSTDQTQSTDSTASDKGAEKALTSSTSATSGSPAIVNLALIGGAVVLVVIVLAFVARRVVKKKKMAATQERTVSSHNSAWSDRTLGTGTSGGNLYSTYSYKDEGGKGNGISMLSDSQASSTYGPGYGQPGSSPRATADFSNYGEGSQYAQNSQYYSDYSVSTGPELMAAGAAAGAGRHYANNGVPPATGAGNNFVDVTASSATMRESELDSIRSGQQPMTMSQLMPTAIEEDDEESYATRRKPGTMQYGVPQPTAFTFQAGNAVPPSSRKPQIFGASNASSLRSDYDIVDPITMRDVEARNTEMLAEDSRYPKFSFESEASSADIYDGSSSEEESDDERVRHGEEHTI
ncbi:hypothetical protein PHMEG_00020082 [Phytophthora megakarya]|uniref:Uncharacterized protein n=1 Tax=Phytophthora megakarya TaxID=4795 RepID=A0A225VQB2_9STRA|nr:hypothetical protein PHMEG_00020082 [Phytophthora megakarya]